MTSDRFSLTGKVAIVTGGTGILGSASCRALSEHGARVVVLDRDQEACRALAGELSESGNSALGLAVDIRNKSAIDEMVKKVVETFGRIDVLHNNAAWKSEDLSKFFAPFETYDLETWRDVFSVNVDGAMMMAQACGEQMIKQQSGGSIINVCSIYGISAPDQRIYEGSEYNGRPINTPGSYCASKAALVGLSQYLATYWGKDKIRVNILTPGGVESGQNQTFQDNYNRRVPLGRMASKEDLMGALVFLASDASQYVTGQNLVVDGGLTCW